MGARGLENIMNEEKNISPEMREKMKEECERRMRIMLMHENPIEEFSCDGKLNISENLGGPFAGILYWLTDEEEELVSKFEKEQGVMVYHLVLDHSACGDMYTFMYVDTNEEEWEEEEFAMNAARGGDEFDCDTFVYNSYYKEFNFGAVSLMPCNGGVKRTA